MLKGISPLLGPDLLQLIAAMGHGDDIAVVDANFPADALAQRLVRLDGHSATDTLAALLTLLPVDDFTENSLRSMAVVGDPDQTPAIVAEFEEIASRAESRTLNATALERQCFYDSAAQAYAIVVTGESRLYGNLLIRKGVIYPNS